MSSRHQAMPLATAPNSRPGSKGLVLPPMSDQQQMLFRMPSSHIVLCALSVAVLPLSACARKQVGPPHAAPVQVSVAPVEQRDVDIYGDWVATLDGYVNAQIQPQVSGYLIKQDY